ETTTIVFAQKMQRESERLAAQLDDEQKPRPIVTALAAMDDVKVANGRASIPIGVEHGSGVLRQSFPVRLGMPFPQGAFKPDAPVQLLAPDGKPVAAEYFVMGKWPDQSLRWLGVAFAANCPANGFAFYKLE